MVDPAQASGNRVILHDDYIEAIWDGPQTAETVHRTNVEAAAMAEKLQAAGKPLLLSLHVQNHPHSANIGAFEEAIKFFRMMKVDRMAISGDLPPAIMSLATTIITSFRVEFEIKYIADKTEALAWLRSSNR